MTDTNPDQRIGRWDHRRIGCRVCGDDHTGRRPVGSGEPYELGDYVQSEQGSTWTPIRHEENLAVASIRTLEAAAHEQPSGQNGNGAADPTAKTEPALPPLRPGVELPGWTWNDALKRLEHPTGARACVVDDHAVWWRDGGARRADSLAEAGAAALGYELSPIGWGWGWSDGEVQCGRYFATAELAALDALRHAAARVPAIPSPSAGDAPCKHCGKARDAHVFADGSVRNRCWDVGDPLQRTYEPAPPAQPEPPKVTARPELCPGCSSDYDERCANMYAGVRCLERRKWWDAGHAARDAEVADWSSKARERTKHALDLAHKLSDAEDRAEAAEQRVRALCEAVDEYSRLRGHPVSLRSAINGAWAALLAARAALTEAKQGDGSDG